MKYINNEKKEDCYARDIQGIWFQTDTSFLCVPRQTKNK